MSSFERLLGPDCADVRKCRCGKEMQIVRVERLPDRNDAHIRIYNCSACHHEMRLTAWANDLLAWDHL